MVKEGGVAADSAREEIHRETARLDTAEVEESDPFADVEDEDELVENKVVPEDC